MRTGVPLVLIIDDNEDVREVYAQFLSFKGYRVELASNGPDGLTMAATLRPDVVVADLAMPGMDGWEVTRRLKTDPATREIPVVCLTGFSMTPDRRRALEAGCDLYLIKPVLPDELLAELARLTRPPSDEPGSTSNSGAEATRR